MRRSNIALLDADAVDVIELASAARRTPGPISPKLAALAAQQEARGWALHAKPDRFRRLIDSAADLLLGHPNDVDDDAPVYLRSYDVDTLEEQSASGYRTCGQADTAVAILERRIIATPPISSATGPTNSRNLPTPCCSPHTPTPRGLPPSG
ncbi:hypothetical protein ACFQZ4_11185 [Catellatospora coxensis]